VLFRSDVREAAHERAVGLLVFAEAGGGGVDVELESRRGSVIERMCDRRRRPRPFESVVLERQRADERRDHAHRMNGRADVAAKARQRDLLGARAPADRFLPLEDQNGETGFREDDGRRQTVGAGADDDCVVTHCCDRFTGSAKQA
jgi:hypothetical protein